MKKLPKPGSYAWYLQQNAAAFQAGTAVQMTKKAWKQLQKTQKQQQQAATDAANAAQQAAAAAAGTALGSQLGAGLLPGEAQPGGGFSYPFAGGGSTSSKLATVAVVVVPFGLLGLAGWYLLKKKRRR